MLAKLHTRSNLTSILEPRCPPNPQLGAKMAPSCKQNAAKTLQVRAKMAPRPPNLEPRWSQDLQVGAKMAPRPPNLEPRWPQVLQLGAKMVPRPPTWSQDGPKTSNLEPIWPQDLQLGAPPPPKNTEKQMMFMSFLMFLLCWPSCIQEAI